MASTLLETYYGIVGAWGGIRHRFLKQDSHGYKMNCRSELLSQARGAAVGSTAREADNWLQPELQIRKLSN